MTKALSCLRIKPQAAGGGTRDGFSADDEQKERWAWEIKNLANQKHLHLREQVLSSHAAGATGCAVSTSLAYMANLA